jgi:hypothetical protein
MVGPVKYRSRRYERTMLTIYQTRPNPSTAGIALKAKSLVVPILTRFLVVQIGILVTLDITD